MEIAKILLDKYNVAVPRYTSYPPANYFGPMNEAGFREMIVASNKAYPQHIAFYIHIPFCIKICHYCGCNALSLGKGSQVKPYIDALKREMAMVLPLIDHSRLVSQIHFGGGTPNAIEPEYLAEIVAIIKSEFQFIEDPEIAIECNPAWLGEEAVRALKKAGFNRFSLGIQDFDNRVLKLVNREPSALPVGDLIALLKDGNGAISVNLDFIYGLPGQTAASFAHTICQAAALRPDRLVTFSYAHVPWMKKHQSILERYGLPAADEKMAMFLEAYRILQSEGYCHLGFDHFVLPGDELNQAYQSHLLHRNFQGYCSRRTTGQVYAFGVSSISQFAGGYAQNVKGLADYMQTIGKDVLPVEKGMILSSEQQTTREIINELMCNRVIDWNTISTLVNIDAGELRKKYIRDNQVFIDFEADGLIHYTGETIRVTEQGALFMRNIAAALDPTFVPSEQKHSNAV